MARSDKILAVRELRLRIGDAVPEKWDYDADKSLYSKTFDRIRKEPLPQIIKPYLDSRLVAFHFAESVRVGLRYRSARIQSEELADLLLALRAVADQNGIVHGGADMFPQWKAWAFNTRLKMIADTDGFVSGTRPFVKKPHHRNDLGFFLAMFPHPVWVGDASAIVPEANLPVKAMREMRYVDYLGTEHWNAVRKAAIERAGRKCQVCANNILLNTHHNSYDRLGEELPTDLVVLCRDCHYIFHQSGRLQDPIDRNVVYSWF